MLNSKFNFPKNESRRRVLQTGATLAIGNLFPKLVLADDWPTRPIKFIAGQAPGSSNDSTARVFAEFINHALGVPVLVENHPGGGGMLAARHVINSKPDGYTFLLVLHSQMAQAPVLYKKPLINPDEDLIPVASISTGRGVMVASKTCPANNFEELLQLAHKRPVTVGNYSIGSGWQLMVAELAKRTGAQFTIVNYKGTGPMVSDIVGGHIDIGAGSLAGMAPLISRGDAKALLIISGGERTNFLPGVPAWSDVGMNDPVFTSLSEANMLFAPKGTPNDIVAKMGDLWKRGAIESEKVKNLQKTLIADDEPLTGENIKSYVKRVWPIYRKHSEELGLAGSL